MPCIAKHAQAGFFSWDHRRHLHSVASKWKLCSSQGCLSLDGLVVLVATRTVQGLDSISYIKIPRSFLYEVSARIMHEI